eukprot:GFUD01046701.1.p1 GENE.GFUD01046701.1~~GFUD01046701.1.p1  ORF type:complete len:141 (+),score=21.01 GFUD01046701.1:61-483(+)
MDQIWNGIGGKSVFHASIQTCRQAANGATISTMQHISSSGGLNPPVPPLEPMSPIQPIQSLEALAAIKPIPPLEPLKPLEPLDPLRSRMLNTEGPSKMRQSRPGNPPVESYERCYFRSTYVDDNGEMVTTEKYSGFNDEK